MLRLIKAVRNEIYWKIIDSVIGWKSYELDAAVDMLEGEESYASLKTIKLKYY